MKNFLRVDKRVDIFVTRKCPLACSYCEIVGYKHMSFKTARDVISFIKNDSDKYYRIIFQGGEPLLNFDVLKFLVEEMECMNDKKFNFEILTNLTIWNKEIEDFIKKHKMIIQTSLDGTEKTHNLNRKFKNGSGSYKIVVHNLRNVIKKFPNLHVKMVCSWVKIKSYREFKADVNNIIKMGVKNLTIAYDYRETDFKKLEKMNSYIARWYYEYAKNKRDLPPLSNVNLNLKKNILPTEKSGRMYLKNPCETAEGRTIVIDSDGNTYPCLFYLLAGNHKRFSFGKISDLNKKHMAIFQAAAVSFLKEYSGNKKHLVDNKIKIPTCIAMNYRRTGTSFKLDMVQMKEAELQIKRDLWIYNKLKKHRWFLKALTTQVRE